MDIKFGDGGQDAKSFVDQLAKMYLLYAVGKGFSTEIIDSRDGNIVIQIDGNNVSEAFKYESGKHQVQRIPPNERNGRMHTSVVTVGVLKLFKFVQNPLKDSDLETICQRGSGSGGQNVNKVNSAVRMKHIPTGLHVFINGRDQNQNKKKALEILTAKVNDHLLKQAKSKYSADKKEQMGNGDRSGKIRTYNFKTNTVYDYRLGKTSSDIKSIMKGDLSSLLNGLKS